MPFRDYIPFYKSGNEGQELTEFGQKLVEDKDGKRIRMQPKVVEKSWNKKLNKNVRQFLNNREGIVRPKEDPVTLQKIGEIEIANIMIRHRARQVASQEISLSVEGEESEEALEWFKSMFEKDWNDMAEIIVQDLDTVGRSYLIKGQSEDGTPKLVHVDPATMFVRTDEKNNKIGYVQKVSGKTGDKYDVDQVVEIKESISSRRKHYPKSPTSTAQESVKIWDLLQEDELSTIEQGSSHGFLIVDPTISDDRLNELRKRWQFDSSEKYKGGVLDIDKAEWVDIPGVYDMLDIESRRREIQMIVGAAYGVPPSAVGFFSNDGNRAKDVQQTVNYRQNLNSTIKNIETAVNEQLVKEHSDATLSIEKVSEDVDIMDTVLAAQRAEDAGLDYSIEGNEIHVDDQERTPTQTSGNNNNFDDEVGEIEADEEKIELDWDDLTNQQKDIVESHDSDNFIEIIESKLDECGTIVEAAEELDTTRQTLYNWKDEYDI